MSRRLRRMLLALLVWAVVAPLSIGLLWANVFEEVSSALNDRHFPTGEWDDHIAVVSLPNEAAGGWTRSQHADLIAAIARAGAVAIGYDVVFEHEGIGDQDLVAALAQAQTEQLGPPGPDGTRPVFKQIPLVLLAAATETDLTDHGIPQARLTVPPHPSFVRPSGTSATGLEYSTVANVAVFPGPDGIYRDVPLVAEIIDEGSGRPVLIPSMAFGAVSLAAGHDPGASVRISPGEFIALGTGTTARIVPTKDSLQMEVTWTLQPGSALEQGIVHSVEDVLDGTALLGGRIVFVGVDDPLSDVDELRSSLDTLVTPVARGGMPGVYVHANAANTILTGQYRQDGTTEATLFILVGILGLTLGGMLLSPRYRPTVTVFVAGIASLFAWQWYVRVRFHDGVNLNQLWPSVAILLAVAGVAGARYVTEEREARRVAGLFRQYVPDAVADDLILSERLAAAAEGERVQVTVLFCDLRGFTAVAADLEPADVRALLEVYYDHSTRIIQEHGGTVMQFVGDEVFAVFGAPLPLADHAQKALDAARRMQAAAAEINAELAERGVAIAYGIGLNSGEVVAAHVGSKVHKQYAVVGQTVNVGARLCSQAEPGGVVLSKWTRAALTEEVEVESLGAVSLKGVSDDPEPAKVLLPPQERSRALATRADDEA